MGFGCGDRQRGIAGSGRSQPYHLSHANHLSNLSEPPRPSDAHLSHRGNRRLPGSGCPGQASLDSPEEGGLRANAGGCPWALRRKPPQHRGLEHGGKHPAHPFPSAGKLDVSDRARRKHIFNDSNPSHQRVVAELPQNGNDRVHCEPET